MTIIKYGVVLMLLTGLMSSLLAVVYGVTEPRRLKIAQEEQTLALKQVLPGAKDFRKTDWYFTAYESEESAEPTGFAFTAYGKGYSGTVETIAGVNIPCGVGELEISGIKIISHNETPGLGARIEEIPAERTLSDIILRRKKHEPAEEKDPWFQEQFKGKTLSELQVNSIHGITGATTTTEAVVSSVREGMDKLTKEIR